MRQWRTKLQTLLRNPLADTMEDTPADTQASALDDTLEEKIQGHPGGQSGEPKWQTTLRAPNVSRLSSRMFSVLFSRLGYLINCIYTKLPSRIFHHRMFPSVCKVLQGVLKSFLQSVLTMFLMMCSKNCCRKCDSTFLSNSMRGQHLYFLERGLNTVLWDIFK